MYLGCAPKETRVIPAIFHLVAITGDGPALGKLSCTSFATHGANCRCCADNRASKFILCEDEEPNQKRDDVEHIRVLKKLRSMYVEKLRFRVQMSELGRENSRFRNATEEEQNVTDRAKALGLRSRGSKMRLATLFDDQRRRDLNQYFDSMPCDIVHVFEGGVFKKILEVVLRFLPKFAEVWIKYYEIVIKLLINCCKIVAKLL